MGGIFDSLGPCGVVKEAFLVVEETLRTLTIVRTITHSRVEQIVFDRILTMG